MSLAGRLTARVCGLICASALAGEPSPSEGPATGLEMLGLHNVFRLTESIYSGSQPDDPKALAELVKLGIKTIVSVDGSRPNADAAATLGLRYVHLPIGYDGISPERMVQLVRVVQTVEGPIYVHCHHGKHRGPAAAAVMCEAISKWNTAQAEEWLREAGTSPDYRGLFRTVRDFRMPSDAVLAKVSPNFPTVAPVPRFVDAMVAIDERFDRLKSAQRQRWKEFPGEGRPADWLNDSILLDEQFQELVRAAHDANKPKDLLEQMTSTRVETEALVGKLRAYAEEAGDQNRDAVEVAFQEVSQGCTECHRAHRN
ncbi:MAG: sulfur transferase domain-containing protein [Chthoniobacteraceae bacterium]